MLRTTLQSLKGWLFFVPLSFNFAQFSRLYEQIHRKPAKKNLNKRKQRKFEQKLTKLAKVRHLPSEKLFFRTRSLPSLALPRDFKTPIPQYRERQGSVGILPARAVRGRTATDVAAEMPLLRRQPPSEPENVARVVAAIRRSGVAGRSVCAGRMPTLRCAQISIDSQHLTVDLQPGF